MSRPLIRYLGFEAKSSVREYTFEVQQSSDASQEFTLTINNDAFDRRVIRFQDAPELCSQKLQRELKASADDPLNVPLKTHFRISEAELDEYSSSHAPKSRRSLYARKFVTNS
jgi:hypothetical protein